MWPRRKPVRVRPVTPSDCGRSGISEASYVLPAGSIPAPATTGRWRNWKRSSLARRRVWVRVPRGPRTRRHADVAQLGEARRSDRRQCRFESDRQYHLDVAQWERTGFGSRGLEVRALPSRRRLRGERSQLRGGGTGTTPGSEPGGPRSNRGLAAIDVSAVTGQLRRTGVLLGVRGLRACRSTRRARPPCSLTGPIDNTTNTTRERRASWRSSRAPSGARYGPT